MEKEVQERFERIERNMERFSEGMNQLREAHQELEASQLNTNKTIDRLSNKVEEIAVLLNDQRILIDQLIKRDLGQ